MVLGLWWTPQKYLKSVKLIVTCKTRQKYSKNISWKITVHTIWRSLRKIAVKSRNTRSLIRELCIQQIFNFLIAVWNSAGVHVLLQNLQESGLVHRVLQREDLCQFINFCTLYHPHVCLSHTVSLRKKLAFPDWCRFLWKLPEISRLTKFSENSWFSQFVDTLLNKVLLSP